MTSGLFIVIVNAANRISDAKDAQATMSTIPQQSSRMARMVRKTPLFIMFQTVLIHLLVLLVRLEFCGAACLISMRYFSGTRDQQACKPPARASATSPSAMPSTKTPT